MLAAALLCVGTGLMLGAGKSSARGAAIAFVAAIVAAVAALALSRPGPPADSAFLTAWIAIAVSAAATLAGEHASRVLALPIAAVAGGVTGQLAIDWRTLLVLAAFPIAFATTRLAAARAHVLVPKVVAGWLLAVAVLNASLTMLPVTPGYLPDHLE